ncbi:MAG: hypothetical protein M3464_18820 [Chloroflexota bacterium]|nr:hypothetical protein [Chloroflexota bacterium]
MTVTLTSPPAAPTTDMTHAVAIAPGFEQDDLTLSARDSGIWASADDGLTWRQVFGADSPDQRITATSLAVIPAITGPWTILAGAFGSVVKSIDGGRQWRAVVLPHPAPLVTCLAVSPAYADDGVVLAGTLEDGVLRSDDRGEHWKRWNFGLLDFSVYTITPSPAFAQDDTLLAGTETALFKSENGGRSWRETTFPESAAPVLALTVDDRGTLWAGTDGHGIWHSTDDGASWYRADDGAIEDAVNSFVVTKHLMLAVLPEAILASHDQGRHWHPAITNLSDGGGIAGVAALRDQASHEHFADAADAPSSVLKGLSGTLWVAQRRVPFGRYSSAATAAIAPATSSENSPTLLIQLRDGSVRHHRIDPERDAGKGNR